MPIVGVEIFVVTGLASEPFDVGTEPGIVLLVDHKLPGDWVIEWNLGLYGTGGNGIPDVLSLPDLGVQWAVQKQVTENIAVFDFELNAADMLEIDGFDAGRRLGAAPADGNWD
jgi:hypothetical protein